MPEHLSPSSSPPLHRELEWQLASPDLDRVRHWLEEHASVSGLRIEPRDTQQLRDTYLDTQDFRIFRAGFALRMRTDGPGTEATLKALRSARQDVADRVELSEPLTRSSLAALGRLHGPVGTRVRAVAGKHALQPLFEVHTRRQRFVVRDAGANLGEIALDETSICQPGGEERAQTQRVEVEAQGTVLEPLEKLVKTLATDCDLHPAPVSKYELGLRSMGLDPRASVSSGPQDMEIEGTMRTADAALIVLRQLLSDFTSHEPAARLGDDPGELHALRVVARRMDAILGLFERQLPRSLVVVRPPLKALLRALGQVRDHDLQLQSLASFRQELDPDEQAALEPLGQRLEDGRVRARRHMLQTLDAPVTRSCFEHLTKVLTRAHKPRPAPAATRLAAVAPELVRGRFRRLRKAFRALGDPVQAAGAARSSKPGRVADPSPGAQAASPSMEDYHRVRRRAKQLRYALEPVAGLYGKPAQQMLRSLRRLQDRLGAQQDAHVARARLAQLVSRPAQGFGPLTFFLAGRLAERQAAPGEETAMQIGKAWRKLRGTRWKALKRRMQDVQASSPELPDEADAPASISR
jgi:CHAD domain-containing protein